MPAPTLLILPGDGIGPEVMAEVRKVIAWFGARRGLDFTIEEDLVGGCSYDAHGTPLTDAAMARAQAADAVLLGAVGGPQYDALDFSLKPERGLLRLRKEMDLYANLRPAQCFDALADFSSLKPEVIAGLDILIVRELTSGVYFGEPRGIFPDDAGGRVGVNTQRYTDRRDRAASPVPPSSSPAAAATSSARWRRPTSWSRASSGARSSPGRAPTNTPTSSSRTCTPTPAPCSSSAGRSSSTSSSPTTSSATCCPTAPPC